MVTPTSVISNQPTVIRAVLDICTQQVNKGGTISYFYAGRLSAETLALVIADASVKMPQIGYYTKAGDSFEWTMRLVGEVVHFVFNDYTNVK
jgi:hypothetical protein